MQGLCCRKQQALKQGCLGGEDICADVRYSGCPLGPRYKNSETVPQEFKQVKLSGEETAGDLHDQTLLGTCCSRDATGQMLSVFLFGDPPGRLGVSSGVLGMLMSKAQKLTPKLTSLLALFKKEEEEKKLCLHFWSYCLNLAASIHFTLPLLLERSGVLEHSSGIFPAVPFCSKCFRSCQPLWCC